MDVLCGCVLDNVPNCNVYLDDVVIIRFHGLNTYRLCMMCSNVYLLRPSR